MHLETESDGEGDFLAAFSYNPGDLNSVIHLELNRKTQKHCSVSWSVLSRSCVQRETVQKKTQMSVAVLMDGVYGPIWVRCASAILDLYWTTHEHAVQVSVKADSQAHTLLLIFSETEVMLLKSRHLITCKCVDRHHLRLHLSLPLDIDECAGRGTRSSPCKNARCINTNGSFRCHCKQGFVARQPNVCIRARAQHFRSTHTFSHVHTWIWYSTTNTFTHKYNKAFHVSPPHVLLIIFLFWELIIINFLNINMLCCFYCILLFMSLLICWHPFENVFVVVLDEGLSLDEMSFNLSGLFFSSFF